MGLGFREYEKLDAVRISDLIHILESPKAYAHAIAGGTRKDSPSMAQGRALHCLDLVPG